MPKKPLVHTIAERQGTRGFSNALFGKSAKASRGTTLVQPETSFCTIDKRGDGLHLERGNGREPDYLSFLRVRIICSEGRGQRTCCRLAPGDGSLKTSKFGHYPRQCSSKVYLIVPRIIPGCFSGVNGFMKIKCWRSNTNPARKDSLTAGRGLAPPQNPGICSRVFLTFTLSCRPPISEGRGEPCALHETIFPKTRSSLRLLGMLFALIESLPPQKFSSSFRPLHP